MKDGIKARRTIRRPQVGSPPSSDASGTRLYSSLDIASVTNRPVGHGIVLGKARSDTGTDQSGRHADLGLEIDRNMFTDRMVRNLLDDWLVPVIVERLIQDALDATCEDTR